MNTKNPQYRFGRVILLSVAVAFAIGMFAITFPVPSTCATIDARWRAPYTVRLADAGSMHRPLLLIAQDEEGGDEGPVPPDQIKKYIAVNKAMHQNRGMTVDQAAATQGMTLSQFRDLENRIERDDSAREQVRDALQQAAKSSAASAAAATPSPTPHTK